MLIITVNKKDVITNKINKYTKDDDDDDNNNNKIIIILIILISIL